MDLDVVGSEVRWSESFDKFYDVVSSQSQVPRLVVLDHVSGNRRQCEVSKPLVANHDMVRVLRVAADVREVGDRSLDGVAEHRHLNGPLSYVVVQRTKKVAPIDRIVTCLHARQERQVIPQSRRANPILRKSLRKKAVTGSPRRLGDVPKVERAAFRYSASKPSHEKMIDMSDCVSQVTVPFA